VAGNRNIRVNQWAAALAHFDPVHFNYVGEDGMTPPKNLEEAAYELATWFFDNTKVSKLRAMMSDLPEELWVAALKKWRDEDHDT
jgi:hypothetical protein